MAWFIHFVTENRWILTFYSKIVNELQTAPENVYIVSKCIKHPVSNGLIPESVNDKGSSGTNMHTCQGEVLENSSNRHFTLSFSEPLSIIFGGG